jgi:hypothetical protein
MLNNQELVEKLSEVAIGKMKLGDFEEWFVPASWNANVWATAQVRDAVYSLELAIAEYSNGHVDSSYLRALSGGIAHELHQLAQSVVPARIGNHLSSAEIAQAGVPARPVRVAA